MEIIEHCSDVVDSTDAAFPQWAGIYVRVVLPVAFSRGDLGEGGTGICRLSRQTSRIRRTQAYPRRYDIRAVRVWDH